MDESTYASSEMIAFGLVAQAGDARSNAHEALNAAKHNDYERARTLMSQADESILNAHKIQTELLTREANGDHQTVDVLLVHAQDHLMTAMLAKELISELIELHHAIDTQNLAAPGHAY